MTATELHELVKPLIGTACEPKGLKYTGTHWVHATLLEGACLAPPSAAAAMWEVAIIDFLESRWEHEVCLGKPRYGSISRDTLYHVGQMNYHLDMPDDNGAGPTRLHALVAAAISLLRNGPRRLTWRERITGKLAG